MKLNQSGLGVQEDNPGRLLSRDRFATPICGEFCSFPESNMRTCEIVKSTKMTAFDARNSCVSTDNFLQRVGALPPSSTITIP